jgi:PAS domain S-box-containing protein
MTTRKTPPPKPATGRAAKGRRSSSRTAAKRASRAPARNGRASRELLSTVASEWRTTVDTAREAIVMIGPDGRIVRANLATQDLFGRPFSDLVGARANEVARPLLGSIDPLRLARTRKAGRPFRGQVRAGATRWLALSVDPIPAREGGWSGAVCRLRDVTERKRADLRLRRSLRRVRDLAAHLQDAREEERSLIAHQIHDQLGHDLAALKLDLAWLRRQLPGESPALDQSVQAMLEVLDRGLKTLRRITTELRPDLLDHFGPAAAIEWQAEELRLRSGVRTRLDLHAGDLDLSNTLSTALFRIVQETLTNVARHAEASQVAISLRREGAELILDIEDDGCGFDPAKIANPSFGLLAMKERALSLGGDLSIESGPSGTTVTARLPIG